MKVFLIGFMGVGKSTVARSLSEYIGLKMIDLDDSIVEKNGMSIPQLFSIKGEPFFRAEESTCLTSHINSNSNFVMATGGGTPCFNQNLQQMMAAGIVVWLDMPTDEIVHRLKNEAGSRPLIENMNGQELKDFIDESRSSRNMFYSQAHIKVESVDQLNVKTLAQKINTYSK